MPEHSYPVNALSTLLIIFSIAGVLIPVFQKFRISPILGYLICGILVGPFGLSQLSDIFPPLSLLGISNPETIHLLGEFGIIFLMFMIGLELSLQRLMNMRRMVLGLGTLQIVMTAIVIAGVVSIFENHVKAAIIIGFSFALSSTAIVMQILKEQHQSNRSVGMTAFSILLMQDLAVVPLLVILGSLGETSQDQNIAVVLIQSLAIAVAVVIAMYIAGTKLLKPALSYLSLAKNPEWLVSLVFLLVIGCSALTQSIGLSAALGAFLAGLLIAETDFHHEVEIIIEPLKSLLLGIFFLSVGMNIDLQEIVQQPFWIPVSVLGLFIIKLLCLYPLARSFGIPKQTSMDVAVRMAQAGEFALLMLGMAIASNIIPSKDGQFFLLVATLSIFATPLLTKLSPFIIKKLKLNVPDPKDLEAGLFGSKDQPLLLIAGYGRVGRLVGSILEAQRIPFIAVEGNFERVKKLKKEGHRVIFADAKKIDIWKKLHTDSVRAILIAIDKPESSEIILRALRTEWPSIPIVVRTHDTGHMEKLYGLGASHAIPEALEASMMIAAKTMEALGIDEKTIDLEIEHAHQTAILQHADIESTSLMPETPEPSPVEDSEQKPQL